MSKYIYIYIYTYSVYLHTCLRTIMISTVVKCSLLYRIIPIWRCSLRCHQTWLAGESLTHGIVKLKSIYKKKEFSSKPCLITLLRVTSRTSSGHAVTGSSFQSKLLMETGEIPAVQDLRNRSMKTQQVMKQ